MIEKDGVGMRDWGQRFHGLLSAGLLLGTMAYAIAEEITLTTYYPSPRGVYDQLIANTITTNSPGNVSIVGNLSVNGNTVLGEGNPASTTNVIGDFAVDGNAFVGNNPNDLVTISGEVVFQPGSGGTGGGGGTPSSPSAGLFFNQGGATLTIAAEDSITFSVDLTPLGVVAPVGPGATVSPTGRVSTPVLHINNAGNIGIGTTTPTAGRLQIAADAVPLVFQETGLGTTRDWRVVADGGNFRLDFSSNNFATTGTPLAFYPTTGSNFTNVEINGLLDLKGNLTGLLATTMTSGGVPFRSARLFTEANLAAAGFELRGNVPYIDLADTPSNANLGPDYSSRFIMDGPNHLKILGDPAIADFRTLIGSVGTPIYNPIDPNATFSVYGNVAIGTGPGYAIQPSTPQVAVPANGMRVQGPVMIGIIAPPGSNMLVVNGPAAKTGTLAWTAFSDMRMKTNIQPLEGALDTLLHLRGVSFEWKQPEQHENRRGPQMGLVAQEVESVLPEWVTTDEEGYKWLTPAGFEALVIESVKALYAQNEALQERVRALESQIRRESSGSP